VRDTSAAAMAQVERPEVQSKAWSVILALASSSPIAGCASGALFGYRDQQLLLTQIPLESPMPMPNIDTMSVRQLIDIVAFLDSKYQLIVEDYD
jgi:hypothetical protein